ncbi:MAG: 50S ribosomal protein L2 [Candidatus Wildermuthbacteria bacterium]|nr:50S ribosomal protein L2 [Candidatus Wildermuthbacteria bacterium]MBI2647934.1 50S ribosomal protein L2 [Candidatus Wildermuthbacteria bacterium]
MKYPTLTTKQPEKRLLVRIARTGGRQKTGRMTMRHQGGGARKMYRLVDFGQERLGVQGTVMRLEYDPNRNAFLALVAYENGTKGYILAAHDIQPGDTVLCAPDAEVKTGNRLVLGSIPVGTMVHNIEMHPGRGGILARGAGTGVQVMAHEGRHTQLVLPSSEVRKVLSSCFASVGVVSNAEFRYHRLVNAGRNRLKGNRPHVRGTAMNPVDHPHGGGEGRQPIGLKHPKTPWGKPALGVKTRNKKKWTSRLIVQRRKRKKKK